MSRVISRNSPLLCLLILACGSGVPMYTVSGTKANITAPAGVGKVLFAVDGVLYSDEMVPGAMTLQWTREPDGELTISVMSTSVPKGFYSGNVYWLPHGESNPGTEPPVGPDPPPPVASGLQLLGSWSIRVFEGGGTTELQWNSGNATLPPGPSL